MKDIDLESKRIANWLNKQEEDNTDCFIINLLINLDKNKQEEDNTDCFIINLLINLDKNYFESLGLLEHVKAELTRLTNKEIEGVED